MRQRRLKNEINVVPYIDVMLVLLVIFMVTAPMMTTASIDVPSVGSTPKAPPAEALQINVDDKGALSLSSPSSKSGPRKLELNELTGALLEAQDKNPEQAVLIVGDKNVKYGVVVDIMDKLLLQKVTRVGLLVQPKK